MDELICAALPYHGTRLFARLLQVIDLGNERSKWNWLHPLQKKGVSLSKMALFNRCASDSAFLKLICDFTVDCVEVGKFVICSTTSREFRSFTMFFECLDIRRERD